MKRPTAVLSGPGVGMGAVVDEKYVGPLMPTLQPAAKVGPSSARCAAEVRAFLCIVRRVKGGHWQFALRRAWWFGSLPESHSGSTGSVSCEPGYKRRLSYVYCRVTTRDPSVDDGWDTKDVCERGFRPIEPECSSSLEPGRPV